MSRFDPDAIPDFEDKFENFLSLWELSLLSLVTERVRNVTSRCSLEHDPMHDREEQMVETFCFFEQGWVSIELTCKKYLPIVP